jgi:hypothetical protein
VASCALKSARPATTSVTPSAVPRNGMCQDGRARYRVPKNLPLWGEVEAKVLERNTKG